MNASSENEPILAALRDLPAEVSLEQVDRLVAAFPLAVGAAAWLTTIKINLNSLLLMTTGTLIVGTGIHLLSGGSATAHRVAPEAAVPAAVIEAAAPVALDEAPAMVLEIPITKPQAEVPLDEPLEACMPLTAYVGPTGTEIDPGPDPAFASAPVPAAPAHTPAAVAHTANARTFDLKGFNSVALDCSAEVTVEQGDFAVTANGDEAFLEHLEIRVDHDVLHIGLEDGRYTSTGKKGGLNVVVRMPHVERLEVLGSGTILSGRFDRAEELTLKLLGSGGIGFKGIGEAGSLTITVEGSGDILCTDVHVNGPTHVTLTGSGDVLVGGTTSRMDVELMGSGDVNAKGLKADGGSVHVVGSGDAYVYSDGKLELSTVGTGTIHTSGSASGKAPQGVGGGGH